MKIADFSRASRRMRSSKSLKQPPLMTLTSRTYWRRSANSVDCRTRRVSSTRTTSRRLDPASIITGTPSTRRDAVRRVSARRDTRSTSQVSQWLHELDQEPGWNPDKTPNDALRLINRIENLQYLIWWANLKKGADYTDAIRKDLAEYGRFYSAAELRKSDVLRQSSCGGGIWREAALGGAPGFGGHRGLPSHRGLGAHGARWRLGLVHPGHSFRCRDWGRRAPVAARESSPRRPTGRAWCGRADGAVPPAPLSSREEN